MKTNTTKWLTGLTIAFALTFGAIKVPEQLPSTTIASLALILKVWEDTETQHKG